MTFQTWRSKKEEIQGPHLNQTKSDLQLRRETVQLYAEKVRELNALKLAVNLLSFICLYLSTDSSWNRCKLKLFTSQCTGPWDEIIDKAL